MEKENVEVNHEQEGVTPKKKTPKKKKKMMNEEHESIDLSSHSLVLALPATKKSEEVKEKKKKKEKSEKKIGNGVENIEEGGSVSETKKRKSKKKKKGISDATENVEDSKVELDEESMKDLVKPKPDSKMTESCEEMGLEEKKINSKKKKKKNRDKDAMEEVMQGFFNEGKMEVGLPMDGDNEAVIIESCEEMGLRKKKMKKKKKRDKDAMEEVAQEFLVEGKMEVDLPMDGDNEGISECTTIKRRKKKKCILSGIVVDMEQKALEEAMMELMVKVKPASAAKIKENDMEVDAEMKKIKRKKKKRHCSTECTNMDTKPLEDNLQDLFVKVKPEAAVENREEVNTGQEVKKQQLSSFENGDGNQSQLKSNPEMKLTNTPGNALLTSENHEEMGASEKKRTKRRKKRMSAHDLSIEHPVEKSGVSSSELPRELIQCSTIGGENKEISVTGCNKEDGTSKECNSTQTVLDLPKSAPISCTRRKLLILDLNGLLVDIVMVVPRGYKAERKIGLKSVFKRPFCDDFLKFCFERFEVGVWTSRIKRNMDDVLDFLMADTKHKLLFCWDQSHCTMTGINTIDNKHKPLVCKELRKLWDKHEPSLPWEKGEYDESNTLLLDDSPYKALLNPPNTAIFPCSYKLEDREDNSLGPEGDIRLYLEGVAAAEDVQKYVKQHPFGQPAITDTSSSWGFYCQVFDHFKPQLDQPQK